MNHDIQFEAPTSPPKGEIGLVFNVFVLIQEKRKSE